MSLENATTASSDSPTQQPTDDDDVEKVQETSNSDSGEVGCDEKKDSCVLENEKLEETGDLEKEDSFSTPEETNIKEDCDNDSAVVPNESNDTILQDSETGVENEKDGFPGFEPSEPVQPTKPPSPVPKVGSLTILDTSSLNSSIMKGKISLSSCDTSNEQKSETNSSSSEFINVLENQEPFPNITKSEKDINYHDNLDSESNENSQNLLQRFVDHTSGDNLEYMPLDRLAVGSITCEVCGEHAFDVEAMENHKTIAGHFKCHTSPECASAIFGTKLDLTNHQLNTHGIQPESTVPAPIERLAQQVQSLPASHESSSSPQPLGSPSSPSLQQELKFKVPPALSIFPQLQTIKPQAFANVNQYSLPAGDQDQRSSVGGSSSPVQQILISGKRPAPSSSPQLSDSTSIKLRRVDTLLPDREKENSSGLQIQNVVGGVNANGFHLSRSISLTPANTHPPPSTLINEANKRSNSNTVVANILANRGITLTPAGGNRLPQPSQQQVVSNRRFDNPVPSSNSPVNFSKSISMIQRRQNVQPSFAVPQGRMRNVPTQQLPTIDLTQDSSTANRGRPPVRINRHTCSICNKIFPSSDALASHMVLHTSPGKYPFKCNLCNVQYPSQQALIQHKVTFHKENSSSEMGLPVVNLKEPGLVNKLASIGIRHFLPLSQLKAQNPSLFNLPIIAIDTAKSPAFSNQGGSGESNVLSLGPIKSIGPR